MRVVGRFGNASRMLQIDRNCDDRDFDVLVQQEYRDIRSWLGEVAKKSCGYWEILS